MKVTPKTKKEKSKHKLIKTIVITILSLIILSGIALFGVLYAIINSSPKLDVNKILNLNETSKLYDSNGQLMDYVVTDDIRTSISINDMPQNLKNAVICIEDERFYTHHGIDVKRIAGAIIYDIKSKIKRQPSLQGASTITQQLIKNTVLSSDISFKRKIQEIYLAIELEKKLTKEQILEAYLNTIPLGGNLHGVEAASEQLFSKHAKDLTLIESAYIAGITQNPSKFYPFIISKDNTFVLKKNLLSIIIRTKTVLSKMYNLKKITKEEYDKSIKELDIKKITFNPPKNHSNRLKYEWFSLPVIEQVKIDLKSRYHYSDKEINTILMYDGLKIYTTMDKNLQDATQKIIDNKNNILIRKMVNGIIEPQASAVIIDYHTGEVKTIIGGRGAQPARSLNRAAFNGSLEVSKPPGSSIKPLTVYGPAIDTKLATAATVIEDSPLSPNLAKLNPTWFARNYDTSGFSGFVNIREAIKKSINLVAIKLEYAIGLKTSASYGENFGLKLTPSEKNSPAALALGEIGTNTLTMAAAYGTFGNNGLYTAPRLYIKVLDRTGKILLETKTFNRKVLSPQAAFIIYDLLKGPTSGNGTAPNARFSDMPVAGKTGTSSNKMNFSFSGLTPYYSGSVWIGDDSPRTYTNIFSSTAAGVWSKIMAEAHKNLKVKDVKEPPGIDRIAVCRDSGKLPNEYCSKGPTGNSIYTEMFITGTAPTTVCDVHIAVEINKVNGKLATKLTPVDLIVQKVFLKRDSTIGDNKYAPPAEVDDYEPMVPTPTPDQLSIPPIQNPDQNENH